ncbi:MAG TPA: EamA family transporter [Candidatus Anaerostipes avistercoris]|uniref:EamA family transporter n=1 Tax=Candidatus Anaerostipes avistercoris TaxID=2838462 RepID=A0A9D2PIQ1_9FIRM|nr:EamA family transporter [uncultured Anaerostipes sp.]HJC50195.1 EamA family transporter [Candidatus Anaerostipes avistercoris]
MWLMYAAGSAFFAGITSILAKCGIRRTDSTVATAVRTAVVLIFSWLIAGIAGSVDQVRSIDGKTLGFLILSGIATGASWLCYYRALQDGPTSVVAPVDKLSVLVTVLFSYAVFGETLSRKTGTGLVLLTVGTVAMAFF